MAQQWEVAQASTSGSTPAFESFVELVMPTVPNGLERSSASVHSEPSGALETAPLVDSPDDAFASHYPLQSPRVSSVLLARIQEFVGGVVGQLSSLESRHTESRLSIRYRIARCPESGDVAVGIEVRDGDTGAYLLPRMERVGEPSWLTPSAQFDMAHDERFFDGPVTLVALFDPIEGSVRRYFPWISSLGLAEAEEHFVRNIRVGFDGDPSWIASEVFSQLFEEVSHRNSRERDLSWHEERAEWLESLGVGTVSSVSTDTTGRRVYRLDFTERRGCSCEVFIGTDPRGAIEIRARHLSRP